MCSTALEKNLISFFKFYSMWTFTKGYVTILPVILTLSILRISLFLVLKWTLVTECCGNKDISAFWTVFFLLFFFVFSGVKKDLIHSLGILYYHEILPRAFRICVSIHFCDISCKITHLHLRSILHVYLHVPEWFFFNLLVIFLFWLRKSPLQWKGQSTAYMGCLSNSMSK